MASSYHIQLGDKGEDLPGAERSDGGAILKWPAEETRAEGYGMERRDRNTGSQLIVPWHRILFVRVGN